MLDRDERLRKIKIRNVQGQKLAHAHSSTPKQLINTAVAEPGWRAQIRHRKQASHFVGGEQVHGKPLRTAWQLEHLGWIKGQASALDQEPEQSFHVAQRVDLAADRERLACLCTDKIVNERLIITHRCGLNGGEIDEPRAVNHPHTLQEETQVPRPLHKVLGCAFCVVARCKPLAPCGHEGIPCFPNLLTPSLPARSPFGLRCRTVCLVPPRGTRLILMLSCSSSTTFCNVGVHNDLGAFLVDFHFCSTCPTFLASNSGDKSPASKAGACFWGKSL